MLFAESAVIDGGWIAAGMAAFSGIAANLFQYLQSVAKLRYDAAPLQKEIDQLKAELSETRTEAQHEKHECERRLQLFSEKLERIEERLETERQRAAEERNKLEAEVVRQRELKHEINNRLSLVQAELSRISPNSDVNITPVGNRSGTMPTLPTPPKSTEPF